MSEEQSNMEFPYLFPKCQCGCEHTIAAAYKKEQVAAGKMKDDVILFTSQSVAPISDMREPHISVDTLLILKDICMQCGAERVVMVSKVQGMMSMQGGAGAGMPPGAKTQFGKPFVGR